MKFSLHSNLQRKIYVCDLHLCKVLLEDEKNYPWLILVPKRANVSKIMDLDFEDQIQLIKELDFVQRLIWKEFKPVQLNVAAIGNKTDQLHIHIIARYLTDSAWPNTVWDHPIKSKYDENEKKIILSRIKFLFNFNSE